VKPNPKLALTQLAVWWLRRQWRHHPPTNSYELPWIDASDKSRLVIGPCVIEPPGLLIDFDGTDRADSLRALTTVGRIGLDHYLLSWRLAE
jgi:hypothetical protein